MCDHGSKQTLIWTLGSLRAALLLSLGWGISAHAAPINIDPINERDGIQVIAVDPSLYPSEAAAINGMEQVTSISQLTDVKPTDWAFQALQPLVERYGCLAGYPDKTFG
ncbi:MAG TPA: S-layer homology domain-containing protein, partial [Thermosynechococcaceae cyanobacterium]